MKLFHVDDMEAQESYLRLGHYLKHDMNRRIFLYAQIIPMYKTWNYRRSWNSIRLCDKKLYEMTILRRMTDQEMCNIKTQVFSPHSVRLYDIVVSL